MSPKYNFEILTGKGTRAFNEDAMYPIKPSESDLKGLFIVCDGVGGRNKGEVASQLVTRFLSDILGESKEKVDAAFVVDAIQLAKVKLDEYSEFQPMTRGMATTLALLYLQSNEAIMAHLGDSRIYQLRAGQCLFRTEDHTVVNELVASGQISRHEAVQHPRKNAITRALVANPVTEIVPDIHIISVRAYDFFFLCSDGILEGLPESRLLDILGDRQLSIAEKKQLVEQACQSFASDNYTAILIEIKP